MHIEGSAVVHDGVVTESSPAGHPGTGKVTGLNASVAGLYNSAVLSAVWAGVPGAAGLAADSSEMPVEPPTIAL